MKTVCNWFDFMLDSDCKYWHTAIWICCYLQFEKQQRLCSLDRLSVLLAALNWMQFRICNFVPFDSQQLDNQFLLSRSSKPITAAYASNVPLQQLQQTSIEVAFAQSKVTVENSLIFTMRWNFFNFWTISLSLRFISARQTHAKHSAFDFTLAPHMNLDIWLRSRWAAARALECRPPDHLWEPKTGQVLD